MSQTKLAESLKEKGNEHFRLKHYEEAINLYSQSIDIEGTAAT